MNIIPTKQVLDLKTVQAALKSIVGDKMFSLPKADHHVIGISGGADSSAVALVLKALHPTQSFTFIHSDTGVETAGTEEAVINLEAAMGETVHRIKGKKDLFEIIKDFGSFLPSARARYCTRLSKIAPFQAFMKNRFAPGDTIISHVGIRADEAHRKAATHSDGTQNFFPLQELGMDKRDVMNLLELTVGIPSFYKNRSRSGCSVCCFARKSELLGQWRTDPSAVAKAATLEKISSKDMGVLLKLPTPVAAQIGIGRNHLSFPIPGSVSGAPLAFEHIRNVSSKQDKLTLDMFGQDSSYKVFTACEYMRFWDGFSWQIADQSLITYSKTLGGLKTALKFFWKHRLDTMEVSLAKTEQILRDEIHVGIFELSVDQAALGDLDLEGSFTWQSDGTPLLAIRKMGLIIENILLGTELTRLQNSQDKLNRFDRELVALIGDTQITIPGAVLWCGMFDRPTSDDLIEDLDISEAPEPCISCSR